MKNPISKTLLAGLVGGLTLNFVMVLTFRFIGFGWYGGGIRLNPSIQSRKLIAAWTQIEFWEFFTPFNQFGEPILLICLELIFWATIAIAEAFAIAAVFEWKPGTEGKSS